MFHPSTERLIEYWNSRKTAGRVPARANIHPGDFTEVLSQVFIAGREMRGRYPVRLAGGFIAELHRRDIGGENLLDLWTLDSRAAVIEALETARIRGEACVLPTELVADGGAPVIMETTLLPLTGPDGAIDRYLGLYQPKTMIGRLEGRPVTALRLVEQTALTMRPGLRLVALDGRRIA